MIYILKRKCPCKWQIFLNFTPFSSPTLPTFLRQASRPLLGDPNDCSLRQQTLTIRPIYSAIKGFKSMESHTFLSVFSTPAISLLFICDWKGFAAALNIILGEMGCNNVVDLKPSKMSRWQWPMKHMGPISSLAINISDDLLYSASTDKIVKVWRLSDLKCTETIQAHSEPVNAAVVGDDGGALYNFRRCNSKNMAMKLL